MISGAYAVSEAERVAMTDTKITLEELCAAWGHEHKGQATGHLPTSTLFDLVQHSLSAPEQRKAVQHLAECPDCLQDLQAMVRMKACILPVQSPLCQLASLLRPHRR